VAVILKSLNPRYLQDKWVAPGKKQVEEKKDGRGKGDDLDRRNLVKMDHGEKTV